MTPRDRNVLAAVMAVVLLGVAWFLVLAPVRKEVKELDVRGAAAQARVTTAQTAVAAGMAAKAGYRSDYAAVSRLGKAVPADDDVPSLLVQLEAAADRSRVDFRSIELATGAAAAAPAAPATGTTGATGATGPAAAPAAPGAVVPATQTAAAALPPGAVVGSAGFPTMPFDFAFTGSFFKLQGFLARLDRFTKLAGEKVTVRGRLLTVDGFSLTASSKGFPSMLASVRATAYLMPAAPAPVAPLPATTPIAAPGAAATPPPNATGISQP